MPMRNFQTTRRGNSIWLLMEHRSWLILGALIWLGVAIGHIQYVSWTLRAQPNQFFQTGALGEPPKTKDRALETEEPQQDLAANLPTGREIPETSSVTPTAVVPPLDVRAEAPCDTQEVRVGSEWRCLRYKEVFRDCRECPEMVLVRAGQLVEGSPPNEVGRSINEGPQHQLTINADFAVARYETTFAEWDWCVSERGCEYSPSDRGWGRAQHPVIGVSWFDVQQYVIWLSGRTGLKYRLLTEAEWEYAARGGTTTAFSTGETITGDDANFDARYAYGDGRKGEFRNHAMTVGTFKPNAFGLYDMHGNVWEWVQDCWHKDYAEVPQEGKGSQYKCNERARVLRGGSWVDTPRSLRSAHRNRNVPEYRHSTVGFRVARALD
jgi:formylglycine-generating enzyme required for sulfatase activity